ncbi:MAG: efflux RND transporter periplasmic adaptor subunit [Kiritimatiellia bacterium]
MSKQMRYWLTLAVALTVAVGGAASCDGHEHGQKHDHEQEQAHDHQHAQQPCDDHDHEQEHGDGCKKDESAHDHAEGEELRVSVAAQQLLGIRTERIARRAVQETVVLHGRLERAPTALTAVAAPIGGRISLKVRPLAEVSAGDVLFTISSPELRARREEIDVLTQRLANYTASGAKNAALSAELETKKRALAAALDGARERDGSVEVCAPRAGTATTPKIADGMRVEAGTEVLALVDPSDLRLRARVAASDLAQLRDGMPVKVRGVGGTVRLPFDETDVAYVLFEKPLPEGRVGTLLSVACTTAASAAVVPCVPNEAIVLMGVTPTIFVRAEAEDDAFVALTVEPGIRGREWTELKNFADDDHEVVVRGQHELKIALAGRQGGGRKAGHFHADGVFHEADDE